MGRNNRRKRLSQIGIQDLALAHLNNNQDKSYSVRELSKALHLKGKEKTILEFALGNLLEQNRIKTEGKGSRFRSAKELTANVGKVDYVSSKYAYIVREGVEQDVWVSARNLNGALHGDTVGFIIRPRKKGAHDEGEVKEVIERARTTFVGKVDMADGFAFIVSDSKRMHHDIYVREKNLKKAKDNELVKVEIVKWPGATNNPEGVVQEVLGMSGDNDAEMHAILAEYDLPYHFPEEVTAEAAAISEKITKEEIAKRRDMRQITTFTIDPEDAKDFDDALSIQKLDNGRWEIGVHIADVSHYVKLGTRLEREAYARATSVYLVDRTVPMLPEKLSNNLCSLRPNEDKLVFSAVFEMDDEGNVHKEWFGRCVIHSDRRFSYEEAQERIESKEGELQEEINTLNALSYKLKDKRFKQGAIAFESQEVKFKLDEFGKPIGSYVKIRKDAHKMIEEFMLLANKKVAEYVYNIKKGTKRLTYVYRTHDDPDPEKLKNLGNFAALFKYKFDPNTNDVSSALNSLVTEVQDTPEGNVIQSMAIRSMAKAKYTTVADGHFGLAFEHYSHFTSPIRRYPDVMAHRLLAHYLEYPKDDVDAEALEKACKHSSSREKLASEAERASIKYKQAEYLSTMVGQQFAGLVSGVTDWGIYVELQDNGCEGMLRPSDLNDDYYVYDGDHHQYVGKVSKNVIRLGDPIDVEIKAVDMMKRTVDLSPVERKK